MKRLKLMGLCLVAVVALAAAAAANASATVPTWTECAKAAKETATWHEGAPPKEKTKSKSVYTGAYEDKACTKPDTTDVYRIKGANPGPEGKYELKEGVGKGKAFKGSSGPAALHVKIWLGEGTNVECTKSKETGSPELPNKLKNVEVTYSGCVALGTKRCESEGGKKVGEVKLQGMKGEFGYLAEGESPVVGQKLESEAGGDTGVIGKFSCEGLTITVLGGVIGVQQKDVNSINKEFETVDTAEESIGEHTYGSYKYKPLVNPLGWADEAGEIAEELEKDLKGELPKLERPILKVIACGEFIEHVLGGAPCTPEVYAGLDQTTSSKGEALMLRA